MTTIFELINKLPQELQNMVSEYNVDHRPRMKSVMSELLWNEVLHELYCEKHYMVSGLPFMNDEITCDNCGVGISECEDFEYPSCSILFNEHSFCSGYCKWDMEYDIRKSYRLQQRAIAQTA